jgi:hypothetical protein
MRRPTRLERGCRRNRRHLLEAERQFRRFDGFSDLAKLAVTLERELTSPQPNRVHDREAAIVATASYQTRTATANFHAGRDIF